MGRFGPGRVQRQSTSQAWEALCLCGALPDGVSCLIEIIFTGKPQPMSQGQKAGMAIGILVAIGVVSLAIILFFKYRGNSTVQKKLGYSGMKNPNYEQEGDTTMVTDLPTNSSDSTTGPVLDQPTKSTNA